MNVKKTTCEVCGGTDFYLENGLYFCSGCLTQTQNENENILETQGEEDDYVKEHSAKSSTSASEKKAQKITTWEYYNYILLGLVNELIELGASETLKPVVMYLWMQYLEKLQVISKKRNARPKIQILNSSIDAEIVYGKPHKTYKRKKTSSLASFSEGCSEVASGRLLTTKRRKLFMETTQEPEESRSLHNETLASLKSESNNSSASSNKVFYNKYSSKELLKHQSKKHLKSHTCDYNRSLKCHRLSYRNVSKTYRNGPSNLSLNKLYSIIYLGLLIIEDELGLAEVLRFIKEGHLSFNNYNKENFFPENYLTSAKFGRSTRNSEFVNKTFRGTVVKIAKFLNVIQFIPRQNFTTLCEKYCKELNLPGEIFAYSKTILQLTSPKMDFTRKITLVPNYEARVLSIIIIVLKSIFGLDGETEFQFSNYAKKINKLSEVYPKMFDIITWLKYIEYRNLVIQEHYFPVQFENDKSLLRTSEFIEFYITRNSEEEYAHISKEVDNFRQLLERLKDNQYRSQAVLSFPPSSTPFLDYVRVILEEGIAEQNDYLEDLLLSRFSDHQLGYSIHPEKYLSLIDDNVVIKFKSRGANENLIFEDAIDCKRRDKQYINENRKKMLVKLKLSSRDEKNLDNIKLFENKVNIKNAKDIIKHFKDYNFKNTEDESEAENEVYEIIQKEKIYTHYKPFKRYWIRYQYNCESEKQFQEFFKNFPHTFSLLVNECARICEQTPRQFFDEFQLTEAYLIYCAGFRREEKVLNKTLSNIISKAKSNW